jgi:hypothetical protein
MAPVVNAARSPAIYGVACHFHFRFHFRFHLHFQAAMSARVVAVSASRSHTFCKQPALFITLLPGLGVQGDAHSGATVKHRSRVARDATQPNLRQVHFIRTRVPCFNMS